MEVYQEKLSEAMEYPFSHDNARLINFYLGLKKKCLEEYKKNDIRMSEINSYLHNMKVSMTLIIL